MRLAMWVTLAALSLGCSADDGGGLGSNEVPRPDPSLAAVTVRLGPWMKDNAVAAIASNDTRRLERVFGEIAETAPAGYASWAAIARDGASSAAREDLDGARAACKACHDEHRARYRAEHR